MKKAFKIIGYIVLGLILIGFLGFAYFSYTYPKINPPANVKIEKTQERLERGKYLFNHVAVCVDCHSTRDQTKFAMPIVAGTEGSGGTKVSEEENLPGVVYISNITPAALAAHSDGKLMRAITEGIGTDDRVLFPMMPYMNYKNMDREDLYSIVAYMRTLTPIKKDVPKSSIDFPVNLIVKTLPSDYTPTKRPDKSNPVKYGEYLVKIASCGGCHTPQGEEAAFSGGMEFNLPHATLRTANITPDKEHGIGLWDKEAFIKRFKYYDSDSLKNIPVEKDGFNTAMPWLLYSGMTEEDLGAIYEYLRTIPPSDKKVVKWELKQSMAAAKK